MVALLKYRPTLHDDGLLPMCSSCVQQQFVARGKAKTVYLLIGDETGDAKQMHPMVQGPGNRWTVRLNLIPGCHRYRFYADDGRITTYWCPDEVSDEASRMDGLDAVLWLPAVVEPVDSPFEDARLDRHAAGRRRLTFGTTTFFQ